MQALLAHVLLVMACLCSWHNAYALRLNTDPSGAAREAARQELQRLVNCVAAGRPVFGITDPSILERATLGEPFRYYSPGNSFTAYEHAEPASLLHYLDNMAVCFPVYSEGQALGTINVQIQSDGSYSSTCFGGDGLVTLYTKHLKTASVGPGQRVSVIQSGMGEYAVVEDGTTIFAMIRLKRSQDIAWGSLDEVAPAIKASIRDGREARSRLEEYYGTHPLPAFDD